MRKLVLNDTLNVSKAQVMLVLNKDMFGIHVPQTVVAIESHEAKQM